MSALATATPRRSILQRSGLRRMPSVFLVTSWAIVGVVVFMALFWRWIMPHDPYEQDLLNTSEPPSSEHWLGTDQLGRDIFSRIIAGAPSAITGPLVVALTGVLLASTLGILSGYMGGTVDMVIQRFVDFMFALPGLLIAIVIVGVAGGGYWMAVLVLSLLNFAGSVRVIRGASLEQRALPYVEAARTLGVPRHRIMYFHIWRNISPIVFASAALDFALALVALSSLSYLGLGTSPGVPEWGRMLAENQALLFANPAGVLAPGLAIVLFATAVTVIGDWVYDRFAFSGRTGR
jgi:peptide/nickel transport system permease protein